MSRFDGHASVRRVYVNSAGATVLDIKPDGLDWFWAFGPADHHREALAVSLAAMSAGWKLWVTLPDDPASATLENVGMTKVPDVG